jgi:hypothetical protein
VLTRVTLPGLRYNSCAHFAAGVVLLTEIAEAPEHPFSELDMQTIDSSLQIYDSLITHWMGERDVLRTDFQNLKLRARRSLNEKNTVPTTAATMGMGLGGDSSLANETEEFLVDGGVLGGLFEFGFDFNSGVLQQSWA